MSITKKELRSVLKSLYPSSREDFGRKLHDIISVYKNKRPNSLKKWDKRIEKLWYKQNNNIMYILYADLFNCDDKEGDKLKGLINRLNYLKELGVTNIHILPCLKNSGDAGFAVDSYRDIDYRIGTINDFKRLTNEAHKKGIMITFDLVLNHTSDKHKWAKKLKAGSKKYRNYYIIDETKTGKSWEKVIDIFPEFAPGHWDYIPEIDEYVWATFYSRYPFKGKKYNDFSQWDLNYRNPDVLLGMIENILFLANCGVDVFRFDAIPHMWKEKGTDCFSSPQVYKVIQIFRYALEKAAPKSAILVEACVGIKQLNKYFNNGNTAQLAYDFILMPALWYSMIKKESVSLKKVLNRRRKIPDYCEWITFDVNHDEVSFLTLGEIFKGRDGIEATRYLFRNLTSKDKGIPFRFKPKIDKYGNAVSGTKWSLLGGDIAKGGKDKSVVVKKIMLMNAFKLSVGGIPQFYQGEELGLSNNYAYKDNPIKKMDSRFIKRLEITDKMRQKRKQEGTRENEIFNKLKKLISIRKKYNIFGNGKFKLLKSNKYMLCFERKNKNEKLLVLINFLNKKQKYYLNSDYKDIIHSATLKRGNLTIGAYEFRWLCKD